MSRKVSGLVGLCSVLDAASDAILLTHLLTRYDSHLGDTGGDAAVLEGDVRGRLLLGEERLHLRVDRVLPPAYARQEGRVPTQLTLYMA